MDGIEIASTSLITKQEELKNHTKIKIHHNLEEIRIFLLIKYRMRIQHLSSLQTMDTGRLTRA